MKIKHERTYFKDIHNNIKKIFTIIHDTSRLYIPITIAVVILMGIQPSISIVVIQKIMNLLQTRTASYQVILFYIVVYITIDFIVSQVQNFHSYYLGIFQLKISLKMSLKILEKTDELVLQDFEDSESYNKIQRALQQSDIQILSYFSSFLSLIQYFITLVSSATLLFFWKWWAVLLIVGISCVSSVIMTKFGEERYEIIRKRTGEDREKWYYQYLLTNDLAFKEIKIYGLNGYFKDKYKCISEKFIKQDKKLLNKITLTNIFTGLLENGVSALIFTMTIMDTFAGKILIGSSMAYIRHMTNISSTVKNFLNQVVSIFTNTLYINQLFEFIDMEKHERYGGVKIDGIESVVIDNLSYKYKQSHSYALKNISLNIEKGDCLSIVGINGSGKTTLVKILSGLYEDYEGSIYINHIELRQIDKESLKKQVGILFQDFTKYEMSFRENIGMGNLTQKDDDNYIKEVGRLAHVKQSLLHHLDQQLGSWFKDGKQLSGGEWIRIGIGRAIARNAAMYILDEPNSSLDVIAETEVFKSFKDMMADKIGLVITHRISSIKVMGGDILVLHGGEMVGQGKHEELILGCPIYGVLYNNSVRQEL